MDHTDNDCLVVIILSHGELVPFIDYTTGEESSTILSHDLMSHVHSKDTKYPLQTIWSYFTDENCPSLANKPRIFLIQACQGDQTDEGIHMLSKRSARIETDSIVEMQTIQLEAVKTQRLMAQRGFSIDETDSVTYEAVKVRPILPQKDFLVVYASLPGFFSFRNTQHGAWFIQSLCKELDQREAHYDLMKILTLVNQDVAYDYESHSYDPALDLKKQIPCVVSMLTKLILFPRKLRHTNGY